MPAFERCLKIFGPGPENTDRSLVVLRRLATGKLFTMSELTTDAQAARSGAAVAAARSAEAPAARAQTAPKRSLKQELTIFTERFGHLMSRILLTGLYLILVAPAALVISFLTDPLRIKSYKGTTYSPWKSSNTDLPHARRQD